MKITYQKKFIAGYPTNKHRRENSFRIKSGAREVMITERKKNLPEQSSRNIID
jgi:hypothetical protein